VRKNRDHEADSRPGFVKELQTKVKEHRLPIFAAAVAFFAFVALIPAVAAAVSITGLVADTDDLVREAESALENSPAPTRDFVVEQIRSVAEGSSSSAGAAAAIGIALSIFSASAAVGNLMEALNVVFDRRENRNFAMKRLTAIGLLIGTIVLVVAMVFAMSILPAQLDDWFSSQWSRALITTGRFVLLGLLMVGGLSVLYHIGPANDVDRDGELVSGGTMQLISKGAITGAALLVLLSWGFGVFVNNFGSYGETYGTLATIIVVLLWLQLMALAVLLGAEVDARLMQERVRDARVSAGLSPILPTLELE
jgi:membrane protein